MSADIQVDRLSVDCRSSIDRVSIDIAVDIAVDITYSKHDPQILKGHEDQRMIADSEMNYTRARYFFRRTGYTSVSYTHLTLPTKA